MILSKNESANRVRFVPHLVFSGELKFAYLLSIFQDETI